VASWVARELPRPLQTFTALYGSWVERLRAAPRGARDPKSRNRRIARFLIGDAALLALVIIGASTQRDWIVAGLQSALGLTPTVGRFVVLVAAGLLVVPLAAGLIRAARRLGKLLSLRALPSPGAGKVDNAAAPRRALAVSLQLMILAALGVPLVAVTQPFIPGGRGALLLLIIFVLLGLALWRSAANLQGHTIAGAEVIGMALSRQMARDASPAASHKTMELVHQMLPGLGEPVLVRIEPGSPAAGRTLAELDLRGRSGATVLAITHPDGRAVVPNAKEVLQDGDVLALAGTHEAVEAAAKLIGSPTFD
jgi:CPA2 family monovalent cation:H+ antiporter-2